MKINPIDHVNNVKKLKRTQYAEEMPVVSGEVQDKVCLSSDAKAIQSAMAAAKNASAEQPERVEQLKQMIESETYRIDIDGLADKMMQVFGLNNR